MNYFQNPKIGEVALLRELDDNAGDGSSGKQRQDTRRPFPEPDPPLLRLRQLRGDLDDLGAYAALDYGRVVYSDDDRYGDFLRLVPQGMIQDAVNDRGVALRETRLEVRRRVLCLDVRGLLRWLIHDSIVHDSLAILNV